MAIKGDVGKIMFENAGGTEADVGQTRSWSLYYYFFQITHKIVNSP